MKAEFFMQEPFLACGAICGTVGSKTGVILKATSKNSLRQPCGLPPPSKREA